MSLIVSNPGTISLKSAVVWAGYLIAGATVLIHSLPALAQIWGWTGPTIPRLEQTWDQWLNPLLTAFGIHAARLWNQDLPSGGNS